MSTRSTTHFVNSQYGRTPEAIIYRHSDGYPSGAGTDIKRFLARCKALPDSRLNDASYLAAKYVVFLAEQFRRGGDDLHFLGVGILTQDSDDIAYRYTIDVGARDARGLPLVHVENVCQPGKDEAIPESEPEPIVVVN